MLHKSLLEVFGVTRVVPTICQTLQNIDIVHDTSSNFTGQEYDIIANYEYIRGSGSIPIIDYNPRNEKLSHQDMLNRGYDQNGYPFAPCGLLCRPNGFDKTRQRLTFCCFKQCLKLRQKAMENLNNNYDIANCTHLANATGFTKHMYVKEHPRLVNEIPRGSKRYNEIKKNRSASERSNSTIKEDKKIIDKPRVLNISRANILAQMAAIVLLLTRAFSFVVKITCQIRKIIDTKGQLDPKDLVPYIPNSIIRLLQIQLE